MNGLFDNIRKVDAFALQLQLLYDGKSQFKTVIGGLATLLLPISAIVLTAFYAKDIFEYTNIEIAQTKIFRDLDLELNATDIMSNFTYGFKYEGKPVDMVDNEYIWVHFKYE